MLRFDRRARIRFAPLQGELASQVLAAQPALDGVDSLVLVEPRSHGQQPVVHVRSQAVLRLAHHLSGVWRAAAIFTLIPRPVRDWAYDLFARHRYRVFGRLETCRVPDAEMRSRFID